MLGHDTSSRRTGVQGGCTRGGIGREAYIGRYTPWYGRETYHPVYTPYVHPGYVPPCIYTHPMYTLGMYHTVYTPPYVHPGYVPPCIHHPMYTREGMLGIVHPMYPGGHAGYSTLSSHVPGCPAGYSTLSSHVPGYDAQSALLSPVLEPVTMRRVVPFLPVSLGRWCAERCLFSLFMLRFSPFLPVLTSFDQFLSLPIPPDSPKEW